MRAFLRQNIIRIAIPLAAVILLVSLTFPLGKHAQRENTGTEESTSSTEYTLPDPINIVDITKAEYSYEEMEADLFLLRDTFSPLLSVGSAGVSLDGRQIYYATIGPDSAPKQLLINAGIHGREYLNPMLVMKQLEHVLQYYELLEYNGVTYSEILSEYQLIVVPMINPDGIMLSMKGIEAIRSEELREGIRSIYTSDITKYESYSVYPSFEEYLKAWKSNAAGVDLNRNFGIDVWEDVSNKIAQPSSQGYKGSAPDSEPETLAMIALVNKLDRLVGCISYHSQEGRIYWDSGQTGELRSRSIALKNALAQESGYSTQITFTEPDGTLDDWCILNKGIPTVTIETGVGKCPLPISQFEPIWNSNYRSWLVTAQVLK